jgi:plasmid stabilization system protein ParE
MNVLISERAEEDLARIYAFLQTRYDSEVAESFRTKANRALAQLGKHPGLGPHPAWATRHKRLRFWLISRTNYIIFYESGSASISIERVLDGRRDVQRILEFGVEEPPDETDESGK